MKSLLVAAALCVGASAWADVTSIYERGTTTAWSADDLADWSCDYATPTINGGLNVSSTNGGWACTKSIATSVDAIVTLKATLKTGGASGRSGSYDYVQIGGISVRFNEQDKIASVDVDGTSTNLSLTYNRTSAYSIEIVIDKATGAVSYTVGSATGNSVSNTAISNIAFGHYKAGRENYAVNPVLQNIEVLEETQTVVTANYTLNYVANEVVVKSEVMSGVVGKAITLTNDQKANFTKDDVTYIYDSDDSAEKTVASDGSTVVTLNYHAAADWAYSVVSNLGTTIVSGTVTEGSSVRFGYPQYINNAGTLYEAAKSLPGSAGFYLMNFTPTKDNDVMTIDYSATNITVVFFTEAEDVEGMTANNGNNTNIRCSNAYGGYAEDEVKLTTLEAGRYKIYGQVWGNTGVTFTITANGNTIWEKETVGYLDNKWSDIFDLAEETDIMIPAAGSNGKVLDYIYIVKVGVHIENMSIVGDFSVNGWEPAQGIAMTQDTENPAIWTAVVENFEAEAKNYEYKAIANQKWGDYELGKSGSTDNQNYDFQAAGAGAGTYKLTFTANTTENTVELVVEKQVGYTLVGCFNNDQTASFFGTAWDVNNNDNNLVPNGDGTYSKTFTSVALEAGTIYYKVVEGHSWNTSWGFPTSDNSGANADYGVSTAGTYDITFTFNPISNLSNGYHLSCTLTATPTTVAKTISAAGYATYCSPFALDFSNVEGLKAYIAVADGAAVTFTQVQSVPANTGVLLKGAAGDYNINVAASSNTDVTSNALVGVLENTQVDAGIFVLMNGGQGVGFYQTTKTFTVGANTAYLPALADGGVRTFIGFDSNVSTIINTVAAGERGGEVYNLQGQRIVAPQKGLYIVNGKKVVLK